MFVKCATPKKCPNIPSLLKVVLLAVIVVEVLMRMEVLSGHIIIPVHSAVEKTAVTV